MRRRGRAPLRVSASLTRLGATIAPMSNHTHVTTGRDTVTGATLAPRAIDVGGDRMNVELAAAFLGVPPWKVTRLAAAGAFPSTRAVRRGRSQLVFKRADLAGYLAAQIPDAARADVAEALAQ